VRPSLRTNSRLPSKSRVFRRAVSQVSDPQPIRVHRRHPSEPARGAPRTTPTGVPRCSSLQSNSCSPTSPTTASTDWIRQRARPSHARSRLRPTSATLTHYRHPAPPAPLRPRGHSVSSAEPANTIRRLALVAAREQAAVHHDGLPGYVAGRIGCEKHRHVRDVLRFSYPSHRYEAGGLFQPLGAERVLL
jgi:hypothetical protein